MAMANRNHKDTVFRDLFGSPERKGNALQLYNALAGTDYGDPGDLELTTLDDVLYLSVKNDVSFLVGDEMVLLEHQSTHNPNMPLRGLAYFARLLSAHADRAGNVYGSRLVRLPAPRYFVLYAGAGGRPEREVLRLSDAFGGRPADVEVTCTVLNVNEGCNGAVAGRCPALAGYAFLVARVRGYNLGEGLPLDEAVDRAVADCVAAGHLSDYLRRKRAEVRDMFMTEYDAERQRQLDVRDGYEAGMAEGMRQGMLAALRGLMASTGCGADESMDILGVPQEDRPRLRELLAVV